MFDFEDSFIERLLSQNEDAFADFYELTVQVFYRYLMWRYFLSEGDAQDLLSDFYLKCWKWLDKYNPDYSFETYIWSILKNHCKDFFKKKKSIQLTDNHIDSVAFVDWGENELLDQLQSDYDLAAIQACMESLDEVSYDVIYKRYIEELSYEEIGDDLWLSQDAVRQRLSRALKKIKHTLW